MTSAQNQQNEKRLRALNRAITSKEGGLTLLEIMISVMIILIVTAAAVLTWFGYEQRQALSGGVRETLNLMHEAQGNAVGRINSSDWGVRVTNVSGDASYAELFYGTDYASGTVARRVNFSENVDLNFPREGDVLDVIFAQRTGKANIDLNNIWAVHFDDSAGTPDEFRFARYTGSGIDTSCGSGSSNWECYLLDSIAGGTIGEDAAMAAGADGSVWASYHDNTNNELVVAKYVGSGGTGCDNSEWTCIDVSDMDIATGTDIVINPKTNQPWISYQDNGNLWLANRVEGEGYVDLPGTSGNYVSTPDFYTPTAELDIRAKIAPDTWSAGNDALVSQWTGADNLSFTWSLGAGVQAFSWTTDGTGASTITETSTSLSSYVVDTAPTWIRVTWQQNSEGNAVTNYYISNNGVDWTNYDSDTDTTTSPMFNATGVIEIGSEEGGTTNPFAGRYYNVSLRTSINGPIIAGADFRGRGQGDWSSGSGIDNGGNVWTVNGSSWSYGTAGNGVGCSATTEWSCVETQQSVTNTIGEQSHIVFNASGFAQVSSFDSTASAILIAREVAAGAGSGCGTSSISFDCSTVQDDATDTYASTNDIALAQNGEPWIAYQNATTGKLGVAQFGVASIVGAPPSGCASSDWNCTMVDVTDEVGSNTSIAFDSSGNAWVAYRDITNGNLEVANYVGSGGNCDTVGAGSDAWQCTTVDATDNLVLYGKPSIAFDPSGNAWVSYNDSTNGNLEVANYVGSGGNCDTVGAGSDAWQCTTVDVTDPVGRYTSIAFDPSGNAWVSYGGVNSFSYDLEVANYVGSGGNCDDVGAGSDAWNCTTVDVTDEVGLFTSIAFDPSGNAWVAYRDDTNGNLEVANYVGVGGNCDTVGAGSDAWQCTTVDVTDDVSRYTSIAFDPSGNAWVSYGGVNSFSYDLEVANYVGSGGNCDSVGAGSDAWQCTTVDVTDDVSRYTSIAFDPSGNAWVSYYDSTNNNLEVANYVGSGGNCDTVGAGSDAWQCTTVDVTDEVGSNASIAFDSSGNAWVSYRDDTNNNLEVANYVGVGGNCDTVGAGSDAWQCTTVDVTDNVGLSSSIAFDDSGDAWVSYYDARFGNWDLKVTKYVGSELSFPCSNTDWSCRNIDDFTSATDTDLSMDIAGDGTAWIAYRDSTTTALRVASYDSSMSGSGCADSTRWVCETADNTADVGYHADLTLGPDNLPWISYYLNNGATSDDLVMTQRVSSGGAGCTGADNPTLWNCTTVANDVTNGQQLGHYSAITYVPFQEIRFYMLDDPTVARSVYVNEQGNIFTSSN